MTVVAGVLRAVPDADRFTDPRHIGAWQQAADLQPGQHVRLADGRWAVVAALPTTAALGKVAVPVWLPWHLTVDAAGDLEPEVEHWGWRQLVWCRTRQQQDLYVRAVEEKAREIEGGESWLS